nr:kinesin-like protein KIN-7K, chloroplastic isoform X1 [Tanacetum cinerariifolium]
GDNTTSSLIPSTKALCKQQLFHELVRLTTIWEFNRCSIIYGVGKAEHRHVGSTNFNLLSSRSHTIFTLTIESSPCGESGEGEAVNFSQLNLIDLAGSESSKAETTGVRQKEGSFINKSLLTLGTVRPPSLPLFYQCNITLQMLTCSFATVNF